MIEKDKYYANINSSFLRIRSLILANTLQSNPDATKQIKIILKAFKIGNVCLYFMPGEIFVKFGLRLKKESPIKNSMVIELSNSHLGYIPTPEAFGENCDLYEANLTYKSIIPEGGDIMIDKLDELKAEHRQRWFADNRQSEWNYVEARYDDLIDSFRSLKRYCLNTRSLYGDKKL